MSDYLSLSNFWLCFYNFFVHTNVIPWVLGTILGLYYYNVVSPGPCILNLKDGACVLSSFFYPGFQIQRWAVVLLPFPFNN